VTVSVGIIGTGFAARAHAEALRRLPEVKVVAVASRSAERALAFAGEQRIDTAYPDYFALVEDPLVESVHVCAPNDAHAELCVAALRAGKHVLCEKPLGIDSDETARLVELAAEAAEAGVVSGVCFNYRFFPLVSEIRERLRVSTGPPHFVHGTYLQDWLLKPTDWNWRIDPTVGGASRAVADIGSHWCDLAQFLTGDRVGRVFADVGVLHDERLRPDNAAATFKSPPENGGSLVPVTNEDFGTLLLRFDGGAHGAVVLSQVSAGRKNSLVIELDAPTAAYVWDQENPERAWVGAREGPNLELLRDPVELGAAAAALSHYPAGHAEGWADALRNMMAEFYGAVGARHSATSVCSVASFAEAHWIVQLVEAAALSGHLGRWVNVGEAAPVRA